MPSLPFALDFFARSPRYWKKYIISSVGTALSSSRWIVTALFVGGAGGAGGDGARHKGVETAETTVRRPCYFPGTMVTAEKVSLDHHLPVHLFVKQLSVASLPPDVCMRNVFARGPLWFLQEPSRPIMWSTLNFLVPFGEEGGAQVKED